MFSRTLSATLRSACFGGKIIILTGPRQVGKTTLIETLLGGHFANKKIARYFGEHISTQNLFGSQDLTLLKQSLDTVDIIFVDEGQKIQNIGETLKILIDHYKNTKQIIVTGSSSFHLLDQVSESLAGRKRVYTLYPISYGEYRDTIGAYQIPSEIESWLLYGMYPAVLSHTSSEAKREELADLTSSALYRDILEFQQIKNPSLLTKLLKLLALQIGSEVSLHSMAQALSIESRTVERYIDLLEKSYIIYRTPPYYTNKKKEIIKTQKIYFYDVGIRNAILGNYTPLSDRDDVGRLWENWVWSEWIKKIRYNRSAGSLHFWRGKNQQEIDMVMDDMGKLTTYEMKYGKKQSVLPSGWRELYGDTPYDILSPDTIADWL